MSQEIETPLLCPKCKKDLPRKKRFCIYCSFDLSIVPGFFDSPTLPDGFVLDRRYRIMEYITSGGMAHVYRVTDTRLGKEYCLKEMMDNFRNPDERERAVNRFQREARILARLRHPSIPRVIDNFVDGNKYYLIMEYIRGKDLETALQENPDGRYPQNTVIKWLWQLIDIFRYLHSFTPPIVYRDLKPSNILLTEGNRIYVIDFGIARTVLPNMKGTLIGTPGYAPPEQYKGEVDFRSDYYALGATLHHLLSGRDPREEIPFDFPLIKDLVPDVDDALAEIIDGCLKYEADERHQGIDKIAEILATSKSVEQSARQYNDGMMLAREKLYPEAASAFSKVIDLNPANAFAYHRRAEVRVKLRELDSALDDMKEAVKLQDDNPDFHHYKGKILEYKKMPEEAEESYRDALEADHGYSEAYESLGRLFYEKGELDDAIDALQSAVLANPGSQEARDYLAKARYKKSQMERIKEFDQSKTEEIDPTKAYYKLGMYFLEFDRYDEALAEFKKASKLAPEDPDVLEGMGTALVRKGDLKSALSHLLQAHSMAPERLRLFVAIAEIQIKRKKFKKALKTLKDGLKQGMKIYKNWDRLKGFRDVAIMLTSLMEAQGEDFEEMQRLRKVLESDESCKEEFMRFWEVLKAN